MRILCPICKNVTITKITLLVDENNPSFFLSPCGCKASRRDEPSDFQKVADVIVKWDAQLPPR